jgi:hypothetical protein
VFFVPYHWYRSYRGLSQHWKVTCRGCAFFIIEVFVTLALTWATDLHIETWLIKTIGFNSKIYHFCSFILYMRNNKDVRDILLYLLNVIISHPDLFT